MLWCGCRQLTRVPAQVHGIWFYNEAELERLAAMLTRIKAGLPKQDIMPANFQASSGPPLLPAMQSHGPCPCASQRRPARCSAGRGKLHIR